MTYRLLGALVILLVAGPALPQEPSLLIVETPNTTEPTVVRTGEVFIQKYTIKFFDLSDEGEEIIVDEEALDSGMLGQFEILNLDIDKQIERGEFNVNVWGLEYQLRIIEMEKGPHKIPPITILWQRKRIGQNLDDLSSIVNTHIQTEEVDVDYISSIPQEIAYLSIRDRFDLGNHDGKAQVYMWTSLSLVTIPLLVWTVYMTRFLFRPVAVQDTKLMDDSRNAYEVQESPMFSLIRARHRLKGAIRHFGRIHYYKNLNDDTILQARSDLLTSLKHYLRARMPQLSIGATPTDIVRHIETNFQDNTTKTALLTLAREAVHCQDFVEKGFVDEQRVNYHIEASELRASLKKLRLDRAFTRRIFGFVSGLFYSPKLKDRT